MDSIGRLEREDDGSASGIDGNYNVSGITERNSPNNRLR